MNWNGKIDELKQFNNFMETRKNFERRQLFPRCTIVRDNINKGYN